jgi:DNA-directed RNA polymerase specialized sigma24 family protein
MDNLSLKFRAEWDGLTEHEREKIRKRLRYYTNLHYRWLPPKVPGGLDLDDFGGKAISAAYEGTRHWPDGLAMVPFLQSIIRSNAGHVSEKVKRARPKEDSASPADAGGDAPPHDDSDDEAEESPQVGGTNRQAARYYHQCRDVQRDADCRVQINRFLESLGDDALARKILELRLSDPMLPPRDIAAMLGKPVEEVYNAVKRLMRKWGKWEDNGDD